MIAPCYSVNFARVETRLRKAFYSYAYHVKACIVGFNESHDLLIFRAYDKLLNLCHDGERISEQGV